VEGVHQEKAGSGGKAMTETARVDIKTVMDAFPGSYIPKGIEAAVGQAGRRMMEPLTQEGFIEALFGRTAGYIRLRAFHPTEINSDGTTKQEKAIVRGHEAVRKFAEKWKHSHDVYFSVATTKFGEQSTRKEVVEIVTAHLDVDEHDVTKQSEVFGRLIDFKPTPGIVVFSGGGFHAYWPMDKTLGPSGIEKVEHINRALIARLGGDKGTYDCVRLLRLPETINHKPEYNKPTVDIVFCLQEIKGRLT
jgi:hypothetical protein